MAVILQGKPWGHVERPWGYEVRANFVDANGRIYNECYTFPKAPDEKTLDAKLAASVARLDAEIAAPAEIPADPIELAIAAERAAIVSRLTAIIILDADAKRAIDAVVASLNAASAERSR
jgi:hypothetical protein